MFENFVNFVCNLINALVNKQAMKMYVKKGGHWDVASRRDVLFFKKKNIRMPRKRGDLLQTNTWCGKIMAVFIANENEKDIRYIIKQLQRAERMAPDYLRRNSMEPDAC